MKSKRRRALAHKHAVKRERYATRGTSRYARKRAYLTKAGLWGFQVPEPKPWKRGAD